MVMANSFLGVLDESKSSGREKNPYAFPTFPPGGPRIPAEATMDN